MPYPFFSPDFQHAVTEPHILVIVQQCKIKTLSIHRLSRSPKKKKHRKWLILKRLNMIVKKLPSQISCNHIRSNSPQPCNDVKLQLRKRAAHQNVKTEEQNRATKKAEGTKYPRLK